MGNLELMLGSPIQATAGTGAAFSATITANEDGIAKLSKLCCSLRGDAAVANMSLQLWKFATIQAITLNGADLYVRGSNTPCAPMSAFGPDRQGIIPGLPDVKMRSQDTLLVTGFYEYTNGVGDFSIGVPYTPKSKLTVAPGAPLRGPEVLSASPLTQVNNATETAVTITFDTNGVFDLSRLTIAASIPPTANVSAQSGAEFVYNTVIRQMILRSDYNNVIGSGAPEFGAGYFAGNRATNWLELGRHQVTSGDQLVITAFQRSGVNAQVSASVPMTVSGGGVPSVGKPDPCGC